MLVGLAIEDPPIALIPTPSIWLLRFTPPLPDDAPIPTAVPPMLDPLIELPNPDPKPPVPIPMSPLPMLAYVAPLYEFPAIIESAEPPIPLPAELYVCVGRPAIELVTSTETEEGLVVTVADAVCVGFCEVTATV